jgi:hypothetical protein
MFDVSPSRKVFVPVEPAWPLNGPLVAVFDPATARFQRPSIDVKRLTPALYVGDVCR